MRLGFIGCGNMATAIISGLINSKTANGTDIFVYDIYEPSAMALNEKFGCNVCTDEISVISNDIDAVILAVKPNVIGSVINKISIATGCDTLIISIAAGKTIEYLTDNAENDIKLVRVMPNINAKVGEAISAYCCNSNVTEDDIKLVQTLLNSFGSSIALDEKLFPIYGVIGGCSPAFAYMFIDELARAAVMQGMKKEDALKIAAQAVYGSAKMILESDEHPYKLIDNVCSPGGTTIEGVASLQSDGFDAAIHNAVTKAYEKDKKL